ncbi:MBL fold metallo-hydrolase [Chloroflexota bacterium]
MAEIIPGVLQLKIPIPNNPLGYTNDYLVHDDDTYLLIDTGVNTEEALQSLKKQLSEIGVSLEDISQIIATHAHNDHYGLTIRLRELSRAKIALHYQDKDLILASDVDMNELRRQLEEWLCINGAPPDMLPSLLAIGRLGPLPPPDINLLGGETISAGLFKLQVLWTPGHSPGHICLYEPTRKILFGGDHILPVITPHISLRPQSNANPLSDFLNSLDLVKELDCHLVLPAHEHVFSNLRTRVEEIIKHHQQRSAEILETIKSEPKTAYQISSEITWMPGLGGKRFGDLAPWDKRMAVGETLAHLQAMKFKSEVNSPLKKNITYYQHI